MLIDLMPFIFSTSQENRNKLSKQKYPMVIRKKWYGIKKKRRNRKKWKAGKLKWKDLIVGETHNQLIVKGKVEI